MHFSQWMPGTRDVLISVLQEGSEHCCSCVRMFGLGREGVVEVLVEGFRLRAHSPALGQLCALSVRWSRQYFLWRMLVCVFSYKCTRNLLTPFATLTFERQEVELPTERHLAMRTDRFDVSDRHFGVAFVWWWIWGCHVRARDPGLIIRASCLRRPITQRRRSVSK